MATPCERSIRATACKTVSWSGEREAEGDAVISHSAPLEPGPAVYRAGNWPQWLEQMGLSMGRRSRRLLATSPRQKRQTELWAMNTKAVHRVAHDVDDNGDQFPDRSASRPLNFAAPGRRGTAPRALRRCGGSKASMRRASSDLPHGQLVSRRLPVGGAKAGCVPIKARAAPAIFQTLRAALTRYFRPRAAWDHARSLASDPRPGQGRPTHRVAWPPGSAWPLPSARVARVRSLRRRA